MGWGVSTLLGLLASSLFLLFAFLSTLELSFLEIPILYSSLIFFLVAIVSHPYINLPLILGKRPNGSFPVWALLMFAPYLFFVRVFSKLRRLISREAPYSEICEGVYVGGRPSSPKTLPPGNPAIVDCTCEFPRSSKFSESSYLCIPTWDTRAPRPEEIDLAVRWACRKRAQNRPVFIHCAYGHGRSVAVTCALLVALGVTEDWKRAEKFIRERRPCIRMNDLHHKALEEWSKNLLSAPKRNGKKNATHAILSSSEDIPG